VSEKRSAAKTTLAREIKMGQLDPKFKREIRKVPGIEKIKLCFQCGTCTADCPIARFSEIYSPRKIMRMTQLGMKDRLLSSESIWLCAACFTCVDHCPQDVNIAGVVRTLRNLAVKEGIIPEVFKELTNNILKSGYAYRIPELRLKKRVEKGLPSLPKANLNDVAKLFDILAISRAEMEKK
jgi:heterodisulfide reductase subunit C